jgi:hypothetical protein
MACHNLCKSNEVDPPLNFRSLLGLGLKFCPRPSHTNSDLSKIAERFEKDLYTKYVFAGKNESPPELFIPSKWTPDEEDISEDLIDRTQAFLRALQAKFRKNRSPSNLLYSQRHIHRALRQSDTLMVVRTDKNLGPAIIERDVYIRTALREHLHTDTYRRLSKPAAARQIGQIRTKLEEFIFRYKDYLNDHDYKFLDRSVDVLDPYSYFYLTFKIHKIPMTTRPIISVCGSLLHGLGQWLDKRLQPIAASQPSYISSSAALLDCLHNRGSYFVPGTRFFTADAISMYTNIETEHGLTAVAYMIRRFHHEDHPALPKRIIQALNLVMRNTVFKFDDTFWEQLVGTAMGCPPAPTYANLYFACHENNRILTKYAKYLSFYKRYIDDVFGSWYCADEDEDARQWLAFQQDMNDFGQLRWTFSDRSLKADFLDLSLTLEFDGSVTSTLFEKQLNLHMYLPPHSSHPPGALRGLIFGMTHRIYRLCSEPSDRRRRILALYRRLIGRGHSSYRVRPLLEEALAHSIKPVPPPPLDPIDPLFISDDRIFLHLPFHPLDPPSTEVQDLFRHLVLLPSEGATPLPDLQNETTGAKLRINRLTIAYHRPKNIANLLIPRKLPNDGKGARVSAICDETRAP